MNDAHLSSSSRRQQKKQSKRQLTQKMYQSFRSYNSVGHLGSDESFSPDVSLNMAASGSSVTSQFNVSPVTPPPNFNKRSTEESLESDEGYCGTDAASLQQSIMGTFSAMNRRPLKTEPKEVLESSVLISEDFLSANAESNSAQNTTKIEKQIQKPKQFPLDFSETKVLRRKSPMLEQHLPTSAETIIMCREQGLLTNKDVKQIMALPPNSRKNTLLSKILSSERLSHEKLCFLFERRGLDWISDELKSELLWERGKLPVEDYIRQESLMLVAKQEQELHLSEPLRQKLIEAIAAKIQIYKDAGKKQAKRRRTEMLLDMTMLNEDVSKITEEIEDFVSRRDLVRFQGDDFELEESDSSSDSSDSFDSSESSHSDSDSYSESSESEYSDTEEIDGYHSNRINSNHGDGNKNSRIFTLSRTVSLPNIIYNQKITERSYDNSYQNGNQTNVDSHTNRNEPNYGQSTIHAHSFNENGNLLENGGTEQRIQERGTGRRFRQQRHRTHTHSSKYHTLVEDGREDGIQIMDQHQYPQTSGFANDNGEVKLPHISNRYDNQHSGDRHNHSQHVHKSRKHESKKSRKHKKRHSESDRHKSTSGDLRRAESKEESSMTEGLMRSGDTSTRVLDESERRMKEDSEGELEVFSRKRQRKKKRSRKTRSRSRERRSARMTDRGEESDVEHKHESEGVSTRRSRKKKSKQRKETRSVERGEYSENELEDESEVTNAKRSRKKKKHSRKNKSSSAERKKSEMRQLEQEIMENVGTPKALVKLTKNVKVMSNMMDTVLEEQDRLIEERNKCLEMLGIDVNNLDDVMKNKGKNGGHDVTSHDLSNLLESSLRKVSQELSLKSDDVTKGKRTTVSLENQIRNLRSEMGRQISYKAVQVENQKKILKEKEDAIKKMERKLQVLNIDSGTYGAQVEYWKKRCELLEKTKRLGYYYLTWYDNVNSRKPGQPGALTYVSPENLTLRNGRVTLKDALAASAPPNDYAAPGGSGDNYNNPSGTAGNYSNGARIKEPIKRTKSKEVTFKPFNSTNTDRYGRELTKVGSVRRSLSTDYAAQALITPDFPQREGFVAIAGNPSSSFNAASGKHNVSLHRHKSVTGSMPDIPHSANKVNDHHDFTKFCKCCRKCCPD